MCESARLACAWLEISRGLPTNYTIDRNAKSPTFLERVAFGHVNQNTLGGVRTLHFEVKNCYSSVEGALGGPFHSHQCHIVKLLSENLHALAQKMPDM